MNPEKTNKPGGNQHRSRPDAYGPNGPKLPDRIRQQREREAQSQPLTQAKGLGMENLRISNATINRAGNQSGTSTSRDGQYRRRDRDRLSLPPNESGGYKIPSSKQAFATSGEAAAHDYTPVFGSQAGIEPASYTRPVFGGQAGVESTSPIVPIFGPQADIAPAKPISPVFSPQAGIAPARPISPVFSPQAGIAPARPISPVFGPQAGIAPARPISPVFGPQAGIAPVRPIVPVFGSQAVVSRAESERYLGLFLEASAGEPSASATPPGSEYEDGKEDVADKTA